MSFYWSYGANRSFSDAISDRHLLFKLASLFPLYLFVLGSASPRSIPIQARCLVSEPSADAHALIHDLYSLGLYLVRNVIVSGSSKLYA